MSEYVEMFSEIRRFQPVPWGLIPDIGLYMDQVITLMGRLYAPLYGQDVKRFLSAPMINNYVKARLIPRPAGKKYSREQIALLVMIVALKQVCSMEDIRRLITPGEGQTVEDLYESFCRRFHQSLQTLSAEPKEAADPALDLAIRAAACRACCDAALAAGEKPIAE